MIPNVLCCYEAYDVYHNYLFTRYIFFNLIRHYKDVLCALYPLFGEQEPNHGVRDNASGAVARMIMAQPNSIPLDQVRFIFFFISVHVISL